MASFQYSPAAAGYLDTLLDFSTWVQTSVTSSQVVWQAGDFRLVLNGTGLLAGSAPTGTITGMTLTDFSSGAAVERPLIVSTAPLALGFKGLLDAIAMPPDGNDSPLVYLFSGNDVLTGSTGADELAGFAGSDSITGGAGSDYLIGDFGYEDAALPAPGNDTLVAGDGNDTLQGNGGADRLDGGNGNDSLEGESGGDNMLGGSGNDALVGGDGNDILNGGTGIDSMTGGKGNDSYFVDVAGDFTREASSGGGIDTVTSNITWTLGAEIDKLVLGGTSAINGTGNSLANTITGNSGNNSLNGNSGNDTLSGGNGNDILNGGAGNDSMTGGAGNDSYFVDAAGDKTVEASSGGGIDTVTSTLTWTLAAGIDKLVLSGTTALNGTGNSLANTITGNTGNNSLSGVAGNDSLSGGTGNDSLNGGDGNDTLNGGTGSDSMTGGTGNDSYFVDATADKTIEATSGGGIDTVTSTITWTLATAIDKLVLSGATAINGTGNALANTITGNSGNNSLNGSSGNDTLIGGAGNDALTGGAGNDVLTGGSNNDRFMLNSLTGSDTLSDFVSGTDKIVISQAGISVGDGNTTTSGGVLKTGPGGFASSAELVVISGDISGAITTASAAAKIGSATGAYAVGHDMLFAVDNGSSSALYLFTAADANALVSSTELTLLATLTTTPQLALADFLFA